MRRAIQTAESVAPAILWIDEIDKAFAGTQGSAGSDGGTASRVFGTFLTWLSEKTAPVFVIATANDISHLPPELLRKGRVDEIFFVDLPNEDERREIFRIHLAKRKRDPAKFDLDGLARLSDGFSGAEIEEAIISGLYDAFSQGTDLDTAILRAGIAETVPLSKTMSEELSRLRNWAQGRARPSTGPLSEPSPTPPRPVASWRSDRGADPIRSEGDRPMSTVLVVTPLIVASWPLDVGGDHRGDRHHGLRRRAEQGPARPADRRLEDPRRDRARGQRDPRRDGRDRRADGRRARRHPRHLQPRCAGALKLCIEGNGQSKAELKRIGEALVGRVTQQYAYHRLVSELKERQMTILDERVGEDQAIHIRVRNG